MNYKKIYDALIEKRKQNPVTENFHKHHIIPKCIGGGDNADNFVSLTYREHYVAHLLLTRIYPDSYSIYCAVSRMRNSIFFTNDIHFNSHLYKTIIEKRNKMCGEYSKIFMARQNDISPY